MNFKSLIHLFAVITIAALFIFISACQKSAPSSDPEPIPTPITPPVVPKTFPVTVKLIAVNAARIMWVPPQRVTGDILTYDVYFENLMVASNYKPEEYYFGSLLGNRNYSGRVVARFPNGDTMNTTFTFTTLRGSIFLVDKDYSQNGFIRCIGLSGTELWKFQPPFENLFHTFLSNDTVYSFSKNRLYCLNANDGSLYWSRSVQAIPETAPVFTANKIIYMSDLKATAINRSDGSLAWQSARYSINSRFTQTAYKDLFFMRVDYEDLYAFDANSGSIVWQMRPPVTYFESHPAVANDMIIVTNENEVYGIHAYTGKITWTQPIQNPGAPVTFDGLAYISSEGLMTAINIRDGKIAWQRAGLGYSNSNPTLDENYVYSISYSEQRSGGNLLVNALDLKTGVVKWTSSRPGISIHNDPIVADGILYFTSLNPNLLHQFNASNGTYIGPINELNLAFNPLLLRVREKNYYPARSGLVQ